MRISLLGMGSLAMVLASCGSSDLGTGMNDVDRTYTTTSVKQAHDASLATLKDEKLQIEKDTWDDLGSEVVARRATDPDNKVLVSVKAMEGNSCEVTVRVQPGDKGQAEVIQNKISQKLTPAAK